MHIHIYTHLCVCVEMNIIGLPYKGVLVFSFRRYGKQDAVYLHARS